MIEFDADLIYNGIVEKISKGERLSKQDLMSIVLLPIMKSKDDKMTRITNCIDLTKRVENKTDYEQMLGMILLMATKFLKGNDLQKVKERLNMNELIEMFKTDKAIEIAKKFIAQGNISLESIADATGLDIEKLEDLKAEVENEIALTN